MDNINDCNIKMYVTNDNDGNNIQYHLVVTNKDNTTQFTLVGNGYLDFITRIAKQPMFDTILKYGLLDIARDLMQDITDQIQNQV